jgi:hypothetical protein
MPIFSDTTRAQLAEDVYRFYYKLLKEKYKVTFESAFKLYVEFGYADEASMWLDKFADKGKKLDDIVDEVILWYRHFDDPDLAYKLSKKYKDPELAYKEQKSRSEVRNSWRK